MSNRMKNREYNEIKNKVVEVLVFNYDGIREHTYSGVNYKTAVEFIIQQTLIGRQCLIVEKGFLNATELTKWKIEEVMDIISLKKRCHRLEFEVDGKKCIITSIAQSEKPGFVVSINGKGYHSKLTDRESAENECYVKWVKEHVPAKTS